MAEQGKDGLVQAIPEGATKAVDANQWFVESVKIPDPAQALLEQYSGFAPDEIIPHVTDLRARAFKIRPYPCIGKLAFLDFWASKHPAYPEVLSKLKSGQSLLDAGCCLGQDLRKFLFDGAPSSSVLHGLDIEPAFFDLGYQLFRDRHKMHAKFISADLTNPSTPHIEPFVSSIDIVVANSLFHLFDMKTQKTVAQHLVRLTKPKAGSMIVGVQLGSREPGEQHAAYTGNVVFHHNPKSFDKFWQEVGAATGSKWRVDARAEKFFEASWRPDTNLLVFTVRRE